MKLLFKHFSLLFILLFYLLPVKAGAQADSTYIIITSVHLKYYAGGDDDKVRKDNLGYKAPARPVTIYISEAEGVQIPQSDKGGIISYSVYNEDEECISTFTNEADFVDFVFTWTGTVQVRIEFADYYLAGWLEL